MTQDQILSRLLSQISDEFDKSVGSFFYDIDKAVSGEIAIIDTRVEEILKNGFAMTASGKYLDNKVAEQGIKRKDATHSIVSVTVTGTPDAVISIGDKVASDTLIFTVTENAIINTDGKATVSAVCDTPGKIGNVPAGAVNRFPVTLSGLVSVVNPSPASDGFDEESDDELRTRYFEKVSLPATSGSKYHYIMWAKEISGVGDAKCLPLWNGNGTVKVVIINSDKGTASQELITEVTEHIEENRPIGAEVTVESASPLVIDISVSLILSPDATADTTKEKIAESIKNYLKRMAFSSTYISYAQIGGCILNCDDVIDYNTFTLNGGTENISIRETEVPVLGVVTLV